MDKIKYFNIYFQVWLTGDNYVPVIKGLHNAVALDYHYEKKLLFWTENNLKVIRVAEMNNNNITGELTFLSGSLRKTFLTINYFVIL